MKNMIQKANNVFSDGKLEIVFHKSEMVETIASLRSMYVEKNETSQSALIMEKRMKQVSASYRYSLNKYGEAYAGWLLIMDLATYVSCQIYKKTGETNITFEQAFKAMKRLDNTTFLYVFVGGPAVGLSMDSVKQLMADPDEADPEVLATIGEYISEDNVKIFIRNIDTLRKDLEEKIAIYRTEVFQYVWNEINVSISKTIKTCEYECDSEESIEKYIANIHNQIRVSRGQIILQKDITYTYDIDEIERVHIFPSAFPGEELYMDKFDKELIIYYNLNLSQINKDTIVPANLPSAFKALGDDNRLKMLRILWDAPATTKYLAYVLQLAPSTVSAHLKILKQANLLSSKTIKKYVYYEADQKNIRDLSKRLNDYFKEEH